MRSYYANKTIDDLTELPSLSETPGYTVLTGNPSVSMRMDEGTSQSVHRLGIWRCTVGSFQCTEKGNELQSVLTGRVKVTVEGGESGEYGPGDSFYTIKGDKVTWEILETVTKVFFTHDQDGN